MVGNEYSEKELSPKELSTTKERFDQEELQHGAKLKQIAQMEQSMDPSAWSTIHRIQQREAQLAAKKTIDDHFGTPSVYESQKLVSQSARSKSWNNAEDDLGRGDIIRRPSGRGYIEINAGPGCGEGAKVVDTDNKNDQARVNETARPDQDNSNHMNDAKNDRSHLNELADPTQDRSNKTMDLKNDQSRVNDNSNIANDQSRIQKLGERSKIGY